MYMRLVKPKVNAMLLSEIAVTPGPNTGAPIPLPIVDRKETKITTKRDVGNTRAFTQGTPN